MNEAQTTATGSIGRELLSAGRNLLLAGIGAVAEVDNASLRLFDRLVERGRPLEERQRRAAKALTDRANGAIHEAGKLFQDTVEYEARQVLKKVGVLTRDDLKVLSARLDVLARQIDEYAAARNAAEMADRIIITPEEAR
ncbi:MAG TPA: phasin family protein [Thermoanaerobaculia bacterium]|nr:phasin family protein [Thermoanaerobaculia bacterium]